MPLENPGSGNRLPRIIVRLHASLLIFVAFVGLVVASLGWHGWGPYQILTEQPLGYVGLYQAYLLMVAIATTAWIGSLRWDGRLWNALLMCAEMIPLSIAIIAAPVLVAEGEQSLVLAAVVYHIPMIVLEIIALLWKASRPSRHSDAQVMHPSSPN